MLWRRIVPVALVIGAAALGGCGEGPTTLSAARIVTTMQSRGVPIESVAAYSAQTDPEGVLGSPGGPMSRAGWHDPRAPAGDRVFAVEVFATSGDAEQRVTSLSSRSVVAQYSFVVANVVMRLSHDLTYGQAMEYKAALEAVVGG